MAALACAIGGGAAGAPRSPRVVLLLATGMGARDIRQVPGIAALARLGAVGWMNARTARVPGEHGEGVPRAASCVTIGAGSRAAAGPDARTPNSRSLAALRRANAGLDHTVPMGRLGDLLHAAGRTTAVSGADDDASPDRSAVLMAMDARGRVDTDATDPAQWSRRDPAEPYGIATHSRVWAEPPGADLDVRVLGDLGRVQRYAPLCTPAMAARHRAAALARLDAAARALCDAARTGNTVILMAAAPPDDADRVDRLAPILIAGPGWRPGILVSASTRTPGLVCSTDVLPTIAAVLGLGAPRDLVGRAIASAPRAMDAAAWASLHDGWLASASAQDALGGAPGPQAGVAFAAAVVMWLLARRRLRRGPLGRILAGAGVALSALPVLELVLPAIAPRGVPAAFAALAIGCALAALAGGASPMRAHRLASAITLAGWVVIVADTVTGARLVRAAWCSYTVMEGGRYYGIGNEYAGVLLAAMAIAGAAAMDAGPVMRWVVGAAAAVTCAVVGLPQAGANAGGFIGCAVGVAAVAMAWHAGRLRMRHVAASVALAAVAVGVIAALDAVRGSGAQTHLARALTGGSGGVWNIVERKAALNTYLLVHSSWSAALAAGIALGIVAMRCGGSGAAWSRGRRAVASGFAAGTIALLAANDSGVLAAAHAVLPVSGWLLAAVACADDGIMGGRHSAAEERIQEATSE